MVDVRKDEADVVMTLIEAILSPEFFQDVNPLNFAEYSAVAEGIGDGVVGVFFISVDGDGFDLDLVGLTHGGKAQSPVSTDGVEGEVVRREHVAILNEPDLTSFLWVGRGDIPKRVQDVVTGSVADGVGLLAGDREEGERVLSIGSPDLQDEVGLRHGGGGGSILGGGVGLSGGDVLGGDVGRRRGGVLGGGGLGGLGLGGLGEVASNQADEQDEREDQGD